MTLPDYNPETHVAVTILVSKQLLNEPSEDLERLLGRAVIEQAKEDAQ